MNMNSEPVQSACGLNIGRDGDHLKNTAIKVKTQHPGSDKQVLANLLNRVVAMSFNMDVEDLIVQRRGKKEIARARQVAFYLLHTCFSFSLAEIGKIYGKDRTTVGHACRLVEDLRDEPAFDDELIKLEELLALLLKLSRTSLRG